MTKEENRILKKLLSSYPFVSIKGKKYLLKSDLPELMNSYYIEKSKLESKNSFENERRQHNNSLKSLDKILRETPKEEIQKIIDNVMGRN